MSINDKEKKKLQRAILIIACEVARICEKNDIPYFINGGTQIGAVRHNGFIPWDDDFDIGFKRKDYEKFIKACDKDLNKDKFFLQTPETEEYYAFDFAKLQLKGTEIIEDFSKNVKIQHGIFVDLFPHDNIPDCKLKRKLFLFKNHLMKNILWVKCGYGEKKHKSKLSYKMVKFVSKFFSIKQIKQSRSKLLDKYNNTKTTQCIISDYPNDLIMNSWLDDLQLFRFEEVDFYGIKQYDAYLKSLYGDYMSLPPESERIVHSNYKIDFGLYDGLLEDMLYGNNI